MEKSRYYSSPAAFNMPRRLWLNELENVHAHYKNGGNNHEEIHFTDF